MTKDFMTDPETTGEALYHRALVRLTALAAKSEYCMGEMRSRMVRMGLDAEMQERACAYLASEGYVDETRYCRAFIADRRRFAGWGPRKIAEALRTKGVASGCYEPLLAEVGREEWMETLRPLVRRKAAEVMRRTDDSYEQAARVIRYAMGRGFDYDMIREAVEECVE